ncbi:MAG: hypothetical protein IKS45_04600 [Thermoguttaceae bacterium]|nr:hypothetical protein [Thermoguttaceae bacterium]
MAPVSGANLTAKPSSNRGSLQKSKNVESLRPAGSRASSPAEAECQQTFLPIQV